MQSRTIITNVSPALNGGHYFIKRTPGETIQVCARIFADGIDTVQAALLFRHEKSKKWSESPMTDLGNDEWEGNFTVEKEGFYYYKIEAWLGDRRQFATVFDQNLRARVGSKRELFSTWYEMFPRTASPLAGQHGTFKDCERLLPRIAGLGFDVLLFPPIHPIGTTNRKGKSNAKTAAKGDPGSPWSVGNEDGGHTAVHPDLGQLSDFEQLISTASKQGIQIAMDMGLRCSPDHPYLKTHPEWFAHKPDGSLQVEETHPLEYSDIINFDFECKDWKGLWDELKNVLLFWADKGIRIFYGSTPHNKPFAFWKWVIGEVQAKYPDTVFVSGALTRPNVEQELAKVGFSQSSAPFFWRNNKPEIEKLMAEIIAVKEYMRPIFFTNTPDILPHNLKEKNEIDFMQRYALAATLSSNCGIYGPVFELMENEGPDDSEHYFHSEKYEIRQHNWDKKNRITNLISKLNAIRKSEPAFQQTFHISFTQTDNEKLLSFVKTDPISGEMAWCIISLDPANKQSGYVEIPKEALGMKSRWFNLEVQDLLTGEIYHWFNEWNYVELRPDGFPLHILKVIKN